MSHHQALGTFMDAPRRLVAAACTVLALLLLAAYVALPAGNVTWAAQYHAVAAAKKSVVAGSVTDGAGKAVRGAKATLVFRARGGRVIQRVTITPNRRGDFRVRTPRGAAKVALTIVHGRRKVTRSFGVSATRSLEITAALPPRGSGLLPGLFPY